MAVSIFEEKLSGGHPNSLGNTLEVVEEVLKDPTKLEELYKTYFSKDAVVRLRISSVWKRLALHDIHLFLPFLDRFLQTISKIDQPSTKWTQALLFRYSVEFMSKEQLKVAKKVLKNNLETEKDWIVRKNTMDTLGDWAKEDQVLKDWLIPILKKFKKDPKKVVPKTAEKWLEILNV